MTTQTTSTHEASANTTKDVTSAAVVPSFTAPKRGRPKKAAIEKAKKPGTIGRPPGQAAKIAEFKARIMVSGPALIDKVIAKAMNDKDRDQMAAMKLLIDRILPVTAFEAKKETAPSVQVNVTVADPKAGVLMQQAANARDEAALERDQVQAIEDAVIISPVEGSES